MKRKNGSEFLPECGELLVFKDGKSVFVCCYCSKKFDTMDYFTSHIKDMHGEKLLENKNDNNQSYECKLNNKEYDEFDDNKIVSNLDDNSVMLEVKVEYDNELFGRKGTTHHKDNEFGQVCEDMLEIKLSENLNNLEAPDSLELQGGFCEKLNGSNAPVVSDEDEDGPSRSDLITKKKSSWTRKKKESGNNWICQYCGNTYKKSSSLSRHKIVCSKNNERVATVSKRDELNRLKNSNGKYSCNYCNNEYASVVEINEHEKIHRDEKLKEIKQCEICGKNLHSSSSLREHLLRHTGETPYKCSQCPRGFYNKYTLQTHEKIHLPEKQYPCEQCDKKFSRPPDLRRHIRYVHLNERPAPVICDLCGKSFTFQFNLKYHMRRHLNVKPVKCDLCDMTFVEKGDLNKHKITHNPNFKPYQCEICSVSFSRKITLTKHQKLHTGLKEYVCKICGKAFAQSPGLYMHMKSHGFNKKPEGAGYYERQSHLMYRNMSLRDTD